MGTKAKINHEINKIACSMSKISIHDVLENIDRKLLENPDTAWKAMTSFITDEDEALLLLIKAWLEKRCNPFKKGIHRLLTAEPKKIFEFKQHALSYPTKKEADTKINTQTDPSKGLWEAQYIALHLLNNPSDGTDRFRLAVGDFIVKSAGIENSVNSRYINHPTAPEMMKIFGGESTLSSDEWRIVSEVESIIEMVKKDIQQMSSPRRETFTSYYTTLVLVLKELKRTKDEIVTMDPERPHILITSLVATLSLLKEIPLVAHALNIIRDPYIRL